MEVNSLIKLEEKRKTHNSHWERNLCDRRSGGFASVEREDFNMRESIIKRPPRKAACLDQSRVRSRFYKSFPIIMDGR